MSMLSFLFKDKQARNTETPAEESLRPVPPKVSPPAPRPAVPEPADTSLDFDEIRSALDQIADVLGRGDGYEMLKVAPGNVTAIEMTLSQVSACVPAAFRDGALTPADENRKVTVLVEDLFTQLGKGKILTSVRNLLAEVPGDMLVEEVEAMRKETATLPLAQVVDAISAEELRKRTASVERDSGIDDLPNLFNPSADEPEQPEATEPASFVDDVVALPPEAEEILTTTTEGKWGETAASELNTDVDVALPERETDDAVTDEVEPEAPAEETVLDVEPPEEVLEPDLPEAPPVDAEAGGEPAEERPFVEDAAESGPDADLVYATEESPPLVQFPPIPLSTPPAASIPPAQDEVARTGPPESLPPSVESPENVKDAEPFEGEADSVIDLEEAAEVETAAAESRESGNEPVVLLRGIDLNKAKVKDLLQSVEGIGEKLAQRIVHDRNTQGPFLDIHDLARVAGVGRKTFERITGMAWLEGEEILSETLSYVLGYTPGGYLSVRDVVTRFGSLPGFEGCVVAHVEGHMIASSWDNRRAEALGAFAPQIFKKIERYVGELDLGNMDCITTLLDQRPFTFVQCDDIFFIAVHRFGGISRKHIRLAHGVGSRLGRLLKQRTMVA